MSETVSSVEPIEKEPVVEEKPSETTEGDQTVPPADKALPAEVEKEKAAAAAGDIDFGEIRYFRIVLKAEFSM